MGSPKADVPRRGQSKSITSPFIATCMATLARQHQRPENTSNVLQGLGDDIESELSSTVPSPFPLQEFQRLRPQSRSSSQLERVRGQSRPASPSIGARDVFIQSDASRQAKDASNSSVEVTTTSLVGNEQALATEQTGVVNDPGNQEFLPTITSIQQTCLMTLNDLLADASMGSSRHANENSRSPQSSSSATFSVPSSLFTLIEDLRSRIVGGAGSDATESFSDADLAVKVQQHVDELSGIGILSPSDAQLSQSLTSLLVQTSRLIALDPQVVIPWDLTSHNLLEPASLTPDVKPNQQNDLYSNLQKQIYDLQSRRLDSEQSGTKSSSRNSFSSLHAASSPISADNTTQTTPKTSPITAVQLALLWSQIDQDMDTVLSCCRERAVAAAGIGISSADTINASGAELTAGDAAEVPGYSTPLPPEYDFSEAQRLSIHHPPEYEYDDSDYHMDYKNGDDLEDSEESDWDPKGDVKAHPDDLTSTLPSLTISTPNMSHSKVSRQHKIPRMKRRGEAQMHPATSEPLTEKMRLDFEAVTQAINRFYTLAPQLNDQRAELRRNKVSNLNSASQIASSSKDKKLGGSMKDKAKDKGKGKDNDIKELEGIIEFIDKVSNRRLASQSVVLEGSMQDRMKKLQQRDSQKRAEFVQQVAQQSDMLRLHDQDAVFRTPRDRIQEDTDKPSILPDFLRQQSTSHPRLSHRRSYFTPREVHEELVADDAAFHDPKELLSLPEFASQPLPHVLSSAPPAIAKFKKPQKSSRSRSLSAPPLAWLLPALSRTTSSLSKSSTDIQETKVETVQPPKTGLHARFVAEYHENLHHVLVFTAVDNMTPGVDLEAEVLITDNNARSGDQLLLKCGSNLSITLKLPMKVVAGPQHVRVAGSHFEIKLPTVREDSPLRSLADHLQSSSSSSVEYGVSPMDAAHLKRFNPTCFTCASCSLPIVHTQSQNNSKFTYHDLPSQYWSELLDAWMCHQDQKLHDQISKHSQNGLWPRANQCLVGGSYVLFNESIVMNGNVKVEEAMRGNDWRRARCICGAVVGRCQNITTDAGPSVVFRFAKYSIRPVSPTAGNCKIPLSSFILEDMTEIMHAHATYRFVILDEEDEKPRLLIWLFKPAMRLSYATTAQYALPLSDSIYAAKILFKILGPNTTASDFQAILDKHPGFPQAEHLLYPYNVCRTLAALLKESNTAYPLSMRVMTGLQVGWLRRS